MNESFDIFLKNKRIDAKRFREESPLEWESYQKLFEKMGPKSFDHQKKFFFNPLRLRFPSKEPIEKSKTEKKTLSKKPKLALKQTPATKRSTEGKKKGLPKLKPKLSPTPKKLIPKLPPDQTKEEGNN